MRCMADCKPCMNSHGYLVRVKQAGTYLLLEKLKQSVYRRLFKRVTLIHRHQAPGKAAQVPLGAHSVSDATWCHDVNFTCWQRMHWPTAFG